MSIKSLVSASFIIALKCNNPISFNTAGGPSQSDRREKEIRHGYIGKEEIEPSFTCHDALDKAKL